jgi:hypothetical protein
MPLKLGVTHVEALLVAPAEIKHGKVLGRYQGDPATPTPARGALSRD